MYKVWHNLNKMYDNDGNLNSGPDECHNNPCKNGGTCFRTAEGSYLCTCLKGCGGGHCENCSLGRKYRYFE